MSFNEKDFSVRGLQLRVKHWHENAPDKVIALHGWLDNAASFDVLAPLLPECSIAAIDLAGQGFSDHRPPSATYHLWDDLVDILDIADQLGWQQFSLIGHSRGAMLAVMLAASIAERVSMIFIIDGLLPIPVGIGNTPSQLARFIHDYRQTRDSRMFDSRGQALTVRARAGAIPVHVAEILAQRQLVEISGRWRWNVDERLKNASAFKMTEQHNQAFLSALRCNVAIIAASNGAGLDKMLPDLQRCYPAFKYHSLEGHHHLHMDEQAQAVAGIFRDFSSSR